MESEHVRGRAMCLVCGVAASPSARYGKESAVDTAQRPPAPGLSLGDYAFCFSAPAWPALFFQGRSAKPLFGAGPFPIFVLHVLWPPPLMSTCHVFVLLGSAAAASLACLSSALSLIATAPTEVSF